MSIQLQKAGDVYLATCALIGSSAVTLLGIVDSGAANTYVTMDAIRRTGLKPTGKSRMFMCIHGQNHRGIATKSYAGAVTIGTKSGNGTVYGIDARLEESGLRVDIVIGRDVLRHFKATLNWRDGVGFLEE